MRKQARQQRRARSALDELSGTGEQTEDHARQRRVGQIACGDVNQQTRPGGQGSSLGLMFADCANEPIQSLDVTEFLLQQELKFFLRQLSEPRVQTTREDGGWESSGGWAQIESQFAPEVIGLAPVLRQVAQAADQTLRSAVQQILIAVAFQGVTRLRNQGCVHYRVT